MKKKDIVLDFTSLLDVTLIVIFFFVLFSNLEEQENKNLMKKRIYELEVATQNAKNKEAIADELIKQFEEEMDILKASSSRYSSNIAELVNFNRSENLKIILSMNGVDWTAKLVVGDDVVSEIKDENDFGEELRKTLEYIGYDTESTIFCDFVFDGKLPGTAKAYRRIKEGFMDISYDYKYFYVSETDLSVGE